MGKLISTSKVHRLSAGNSKLDLSTYDFDPDQILVRRFINLTRRAQRTHRVRRI